MAEKTNGGQHKWILIVAAALAAGAGGFYYFYHGHSSDTLNINTVAATLAAQPQENQFETATNAAQTALANGQYDDAVTQATVALVLKPDDAGAQTLLAQAKQKQTYSQFEDYLDRAEKLKVDDPEQAKQNLDAAEQLKPNNADVINLRIEIQNGQKLDAQLLDMMKQFGVSGHGKAIDPQKSSKQKLTVMEMSDLAIDHQSICETLKNAYQNLNRKINNL